MATVSIFPVPASQFATLVGSAGYTPGSGQVGMATGAGTKLQAACSALGRTGPSTANPVILTMIRAAALDAYGRITDPTQVAEYKCTGLTGDTATGLTLADGTTDISFASGDTIAILDSANYWQSAYTAINALENALTAASPATNLVYASPNGAAGNPTFRSLVAADLPNTAVTPGSYTSANITVDQQGRITAAANGTGGGGGLTSVGLSMPARFNVANSPLTGNGTIAVTDANENANLVFAGPASGGAAPPSYRNLVDADLTAATHAALSNAANTFTATQQFNGKVGIETAPTHGLHGLGGSWRLQALATPNAPTVTPTGNAGTTTYNYYVVAIDVAGNKSLPSAVGTTATGNATLSGTNYNALSWTAVPGAVAYDVLRGDTAHSIATALAATTLNDTGLATSAYTVPTRNATADLIFDGTVTIGANGGSYSTPDLAFNNAATSNPVIKWNPLAAQTGMQFYSGSTKIAQFQDNGVCQFASMSTLNNMSLGNWFIQRGNGNQKISANIAANPAWEATGDGTTAYSCIFRATATQATDQPLAIMLAASQSADAMQVVKSNGTTVVFAHDFLGRPYSANTTPTIAGGTGAGSGGTGAAVTISGTDVDGTITITTPTGGTAPAASAVVATATFSAAYASAPRGVVLTPANAATAALSGAAAVWPDAGGISTAAFTLNVGATPLAAGTTYKWYYRVAC